MPTMLSKLTMTKITRKLTVKTSHVNAVSIPAAYSEKLSMHVSRLEIICSDFINNDSYINCNDHKRVSQLPLRTRAI